MQRKMAAATTMPRRLIVLMLAAVGAVSLAGAGTAMRGIDVQAGIAPPHAPRV